MRILAIETSCDETAVALISNDGGRFLVEESLVSSQIATHAKYGGVVPEVAARLHVKVLPRMIEVLTNWKSTGIDAVAVTAGPGLATSLRVGIETAKALTVSWGVPLVPVDHIEGHIFANFLVSPDSKFLNSSIPQFPALCLVVSGGHTELVLMKSFGEYEIIGRTRDDAAGECFDKSAALLGLPYPGGPEISCAAENGRRYAYELPRPMIDSPDFDFSFSGLKTAMKRLVEDVSFERNDNTIADASASFEESVVDVLISKTRRAAETYSVASILLCGGVAANKRLRERLVASFQNTSVVVMIPELKYAGDNAAMIGAAGLMRLGFGQTAADPYSVDAYPSHQIGGVWD
ncbi:MAG: tRNA (adenosine(37)-N6)-threonylcarbamoyltransferase complex transferase subunit TsaD [Patescibacteria group bacterium]